MFGVELQVASGRVASFQLGYGSFFFVCMFLLEESVLSPKVGGENLVWITVVFFFVCMFLLEESALSRKVGVFIWRFGPMSDELGSAPSYTLRVK